jgi:hypothetical protein
VAARGETCYSRVSSCVLELSAEDLEQLRVGMYEMGLKRDFNILDSLLKRNATLKKGF